MCGPEVKIREDLKIQKLRICPPPPGGQDLPSGPFFRILLIYLKVGAMTLVLQLIHRLLRGRVNDDLDVCVVLLCVPGLMMIRAFASFYCVWG